MVKFLYDLATVNEVYVDWMIAVVAVVLFISFLVHVSIENRKSR